MGKGAYGKVWEGLLDSGTLIAVKEVELDFVNLEKAQSVSACVPLLINRSYLSVCGCPVLIYGLHHKIISICTKTLSQEFNFYLICSYYLLLSQLPCSYIRILAIRTAFIFLVSYIRVNSRGLAL